MIFLQLHDNNQNRLTGIHCGRICETRFVPLFFYARIEASFMCSGSLKPGVLKQNNALFQNLRPQKWGGRRRRRLQIDQRNLTVKLATAFSPAARRAGTCGSHQSIALQKETFWSTGRSPARPQRTPRKKARKPGNAHNRLSCIRPVLPHGRGKYKSYEAPGLPGFAVRRCTTHVAHTARMRVHALPIGNHAGQDGGKSGLG